MKKFLLFTVTAILCSSLLCSILPFTAVAATGDETLKFLSYNICASGGPGDTMKDNSLYISARSSSVFNLILTGGDSPDVISLVEANDAWKTLINQRLVQEAGYTAYGYSSKGNLLSAVSETWDLVNLVLYKTSKFNLLGSGHFWCSSTPDTPNTFTIPSGTVGDFGRCINWVKLESKETGNVFFAASVHIDAKNQSVRAYSTTLMRTRMAEVAGGAPVVFMGDFNAVSTKSEITSMLSDGYSDARSVASSTTSMGTYNAWDKSKDMTKIKPIDLCIFTSNTFTINSYRVLDTLMSSGYAPSDHYPIAINASLSSSKAGKNFLRLNSNATYTQDYTNNMISKIKESTSVALFLSYFAYSSSLTVKDSNGNAISGNTKVGTGCVVTGLDRSFQTVLQKADLNGDGLITSTDYLMLKKYFSGGSLTKLQRQAADVNDSNSISSSDYTRIKKYLAGTLDFYS